MRVVVLAAEGLEDLEYWVTVMRLRERRFDEVLDLVRSVHHAGKPIGIICDGGLVAISARILERGDPATGSLGIRDDLVNAGARWVDEPAFRNGSLVWGRVVDDIPAFLRS